MRHTISFSQSVRKGPRPILSSGLLTPTDSIEDVSARISFEKPNHPYHTPPRTKSSSHLSDAFTQMRDGTDEDMDMTEEAQDSPIAWWQSTRQSKSSPVPSPLTLAPTTRHLSIENAASARIPTPIYGHFQSLDVMDTDDNSLARPPISHLNQPARPRVLRLPTAIEEDECLESFGTGEPVPQRDPQKSLTLSTYYPCPPEASSRRNSFMHKLKSWAQGDGFTSDKREHRSKTVLSMGFRADCQKCLHKVPGHFNHIIRD